MEKLYFYKIELKTDYLIVFGESNDPFCKNEKSYDFFINNIKSQGLDIQFGCKSNYDLVHKYDFESIGFNQIIKNEINEKNIVFDELMGILRKGKWGYFATRYLSCVNLFTSILIAEKEISLAKPQYEFLLNSERALGERIFEIAYEYFQQSESEEYFKIPYKLSLEEFKNTISLEQIEINNTNDISFYFRPSWDEEHGLYVKVNIQDESIYIDL